MIFPEIAHEVRASSRRFLLFQRAIHNKRGETEVHGVERLWIGIVVMGMFVHGVGTTAVAAESAVPVDFNEFEAGRGISVVQEDSGALRAVWPISANTRGELQLDLTEGKPLIRALGLSEDGEPMQVIVSGLDPVTTLTIGERDREKASQAFRGMVFFENPRERPYEVHGAVLTKRDVRVESEGSRATIRVGDVSAGSFHGELWFTLYRNSPLVRVESVLSTDEEMRAILYDAGISSEEPDWDSVVWLDPEDGLHRRKVTESNSATPLAVKYRVIVAEGKHGSVAVFPAPHKYFDPLDFANNFGFAWTGRDYREMGEGLGLGIRQPLEGDKRWVPWFDAPPGKEHHLAMFLLLSSGDGEEAIREVARYTRGDRFKALPGYRTFSSHYHVEHTVDFLERQKQQGTDGVPHGLETPGFVSKFKDTGVEIVHLAEFHFGWTPGQKMADRLHMLKTMHNECERLSDDQFLLLPGEEPNVHLGGHWLSFFPKPVYWVLNRAEGESFAEQIDDYGTVYRVGSSKDVLELMKRENGLMWTAHPRIKGSREFPDGYRTEEFFKSDHFLGAAWKSMPADLSRPTLGWRALDLLDDMNQWGDRKQVLGEVDVFKIEPDYELYAHMNINYLKLDALPKFNDGWQPVLDALRGGQFFTTTGEILIPKFSVSGHESGDTFAGDEAGSAVVEASVEWTFPLAFAEIVSGDGNQVYCKRIDFSDTEDFGSRELRIPVDLVGRKWARFEIWDIAANGAFTQPVWIE